MSHLITLLQRNKIIVQDGFNRGDNASTLGNANTGQVWSGTAGTFGISGNQAYIASAPATTDLFQTIDSGQSNVTVSAKLTTLVTQRQLRIICRFTNASNYIFVDATPANNYRLFKRTGGTNTVLGAGGIMAKNDTIQIKLSGSMIRVYVNGILIITVTETFNQTATRHGIGGFSDDLTGRLDNFVIEAVS